MYLKKIKIFGFKSFADEIVFDFSSGLTAIVGPNGCGKSNLLDAVNWVLGEQSAGRLRGNEMQDMIFKGSKTRKPVGLAYVELTLDNSKDILMTAYDEVTIMRKLYRSGESEYYINRTPCRLKDIKELFLDTGIGTRSYSIMEQDNVRFILESSPLERRGIIEEAAGIRKFSERKLESERRLDRIKSELNEIKNIMAEVFKNIRRLKRQSYRANKYKEFKKELNHLEVSRLCQDYCNIKEFLEGKFKTISADEDKVVKLTSAKNVLLAEVSGLEEKKTQIEEKILSASRNAYKTESDADILKNSIENFDTSRKRLNDEILRTKNNYEYNKDNIKNFSDKIVKMEKTQDKKAEEEYSNVQSNLKEREEKQEKILEQSISLKNKIIESEKTLFGYKENEIQLKHKKEFSEVKVQGLKAKKERFNSDYAELKVEFKKKTDLMKSSNEKIKDFSDNEEELREKLKNLNIEIQSAEKERETLIASYHAKKSEFDASKKYLPELISIEKLAASKINGIQGTVLSILEKNLTNNEVQSILNILGEKSGWMLADNRFAAEKAITFLKEKNLPPLTFIVKDFLKLKDISKKYSFPDTIGKEFKMVLLYLVKTLKIENDLIWLDDCIITGGGENPPQRQRVLGLEKNIENIKNNLHKSESTSEKLKLEKEILIRKINKLNLEKGVLLNELSNLGEQSGQLTGKMKFLENELKTINEEFKNIENENIFVSKMAHINKELKKTESELINLKENLSENQLLSEKNSIEITELKARKIVLDEVVGSKIEDIGRFLNEKERLTKENFSLEELIGNLKSDRTRQEKKYEQDTKEIENIKKIRKNLLSEIGETEEKKASIVNKLKLLNEEIKKISQNLDDLKSKVADGKQNEERLKERINSIKIRLKEDMNIVLSEALKNYQKESIDEKDIITLKEKLKNIGSVNLEAPEEFKKESERFDFIKKHVDDIEEADRNIRSIIRKINKDTRGRFFDTFNKINENFKNIFTKLFEGGDAKLLLTEPDNILESGIDISARPAGKAAISLKLISGGESALCAIALMFAIYEVKPTPFCILDEVDSALDDTNLRRFLRMLGDYTDTTQFIIVTHNKQTMKMCDTFYGITMEEFGVSKMISVKLTSVGTAGNV